MRIEGIFVASLNIQVSLFRVKLVAFSPTKPRGYYELSV
jgi:hypothetical protein